MIHSTINSGNFLDFLHFKYPAGLSFPCLKHLETEYWGKSGWVHKCTLHKCTLLLSLPGLTASFRYDFLTFIMIFWIFINIFRVLFFYFLYSLEIIHIPITQTNFGKISSRFSFSLEDFLFMILSSDIFLFPFEISQKKLVRKIFTVHTFSVAEKVARSFTASFRGSIYFSSRSLLLLLSRLRNPPETHHQN